ncbi:hypothetical protein BO99DRAFT_77771 [Aspergillus violaceofuscus CBS 115571]|uniref:Secreted protein n=1 Tax=Aspergillus violaceofuscus (strain CBS 115571) TaxID=1450538 RepID=A0A2V5IBS5_ASPV1|nr:hypothetical protein BO99DRAFT_77771 [Aspergillus violaceofuscus CBS 115571]
MCQRERQKQCQSFEFLFLLLFNILLYRACCSPLLDNRSTLSLYKKRIRGAQEPEPISHPRRLLFVTPDRLIGRDEHPRGL